MYELVCVRIRAQASHFVHERSGLVCQIWFVCATVAARARLYAGGVCRPLRFFRTYLSRIETGAANPTLNAVEVIAIALGVKLADLFQTIETS